MPSDDAHKNLKICRLINSACHKKMPLENVNIWSLKVCIACMLEQCHQCTNRRTMPHIQSRTSTNHSIFTRKLTVFHHQLVKLFNQTLTCDELWACYLIVLYLKTWRQRLGPWPFLKKLLTAAQQLNNEFSRALVVLIFYSLSFFKTPERSFTCFPPYTICL